MGGFTTFDDLQFPPFSGTVSLPVCCVAPMLNSDGLALQDAVANLPRTKARWRIVAGPCHVFREQISARNVGVQ